MQNRKAILMCNLKPAKMRGIMSEAMVMCASTPEKVEILSPPEDSIPGGKLHIFYDFIEESSQKILNDIYIDSKYLLWWPNRLSFIV